jgi:hypothetical protein
MKMTMHIDEALWKRLQGVYGFESKTETINAALAWRWTGGTSCGPTPKAVWASVARNSCDAVDPACDVAWPAVGEDSVDGK